MAEITPRWEWRSFGQRFGEAEGRLAQLDPNGVQESDEIYLLSGAGANVKVRDALMDIKVLREVNADGLEQCAGHEGRVSVASGRRGKRVRVATAAGAFDVPRELHARRVRRSVRQAGRCDSHGESPQAADPLHGRRVHGRTVRGGSERQAHPHDRRRVDRCGRSHLRRPGTRPGRLHEHQLSARIGSPDR